MWILADLQYCFVQWELNSENIIQWQEINSWGVLQEEIRIQDKKVIFFWNRSRGSQKDVVYLGWPIAPSYMSPKCWRGGLWGLSQWVQLCTWKVWRSKSIFNLWIEVTKKIILKYQNNSSPLHTCHPFPLNVANPTVIKCLSCATFPCKLWLYLT